MDSSLGLSSLQQAVLREFFARDMCQLPATPAELEAFRIDLVRRLRRLDLPADWKSQAVQGNLPRRDSGFRRDPRKIRLSRGQSLDSGGRGSRARHPFA